MENVSTSQRWFSLVSLVMDRMSIFRQTFKRHQAHSNVHRFALWNRMMNTFIHLHIVIVLWHGNFHQFSARIEFTNQISATRIVRIFNLPEAIQNIDIHVWVRSNLFEKCLSGVNGMKGVKIRRFRHWTIQHFMATGRLRSNFSTCSQISID